MSKARIAIAALSIVALLTLSAGTFAFGEKLYKWKDEQGVWNITNDPDKVPEEVMSGRSGEVQTEGTRSIRQRLIYYYAQARDSRTAQAALAIAGTIAALILAAYLIKKRKIKRFQDGVNEEISQYEKRSREPL